MYWKWVPGYLSRMLGLVFLVSALLKAVDPKGFGVQIQMYGIVRQAGIVFWTAIGVILMEGLLGAALISGWKARGWPLKAAGLMLVAFTGLIAYGWVFRGLDECGCMGKYVPMTPLVSILKNIVLFGMVVGGLWGGGRRALAGEDGVSGGGAPVGRRFGWVQIGAFVVSVSVLGVALALGLRGTTGSAYASTTETATRSASSTSVGAKTPYAQFVFEPEDAPRIDLGTGSQLVLFLSASCEHCEAAIPKINDLIDTLGDDLPPVTGLMLGDEDTLKQFRETTKPSFPTILIDPMVFFEFIGDAPPRYVLVRQGKEVSHWDDEFPTMEVLLTALSELPAGDTDGTSALQEQARIGTVPSD